jgi:hypothetical protein
VLYLLLVPAVEEAIRQPRQQIEALVGLAQEKRAPIGADRAPVKPGHNFTGTAGFKSEAGLGTICHSESRPLFGVNCCAETQLCHKRAAFANTL